MSRPAAVGRADLLRLLEALGEDGLVHGAALAGLAPVRTEKVVRPRPPAPSPSRTPTPVQHRPEPAPTRTAAVGGLVFHRVVERTAIPRARAVGEVPDWYARARPLPELTLLPGDLAPPVPDPLTPWRRLWPFLRAALGRVREGRAADIRRLLRLAARARLPRRLPRRRRDGWAPECRLILDFSARLAPVRQDLWGLIQPLARLRGRLGLQLYAVVDGPDGTWHAPGRDGDWPPLPAPAPPAPGTPVLVIGDLGCYGGGDERQAWLGLSEHMRRAGCPPLALVPCRRRLWDHRLAALFRPLVWDRSSPLPRWLPARSVSPPLPMRPMPISDQRSPPTRPPSACSTCWPRRCAWSRPCCAPCAVGSRASTSAPRSGPGCTRT